MQCTMQWMANGSILLLEKYIFSKSTPACLVRWVIYLSLPPKCICECGTNIFVFQILFAFRSRTPSPAPSEYFAFLFVLYRAAATQNGITCGAIEEASRSSKAIDERIIINFCDKNAVTARFRNKHDVFIFYEKMSLCIMICRAVSWYVKICMTKM